MDMQNAFTYECSGEIVKNVNPEEDTLDEEGNIGSNVRKEEPTVSFQRFTTDIYVSTTDRLLTFETFRMTYEDEE